MFIKSYIVICIFAENKKSAIFDRSVGCLRYNRLICLFMMLHEGGIDVYDGLLLRIIDSCNDIILTGNNIFCDVEYSANQSWFPKYISYEKYLYHLIQTSSIAKYFIFF